MLLAICTECGYEWNYEQEIQEWVPFATFGYEVSCPKCGCFFILPSGEWEKTR